MTTEERMNGTESAIAILGTVAILAFGWGWKYYLDIGLRKHQESVQAELSARETERHKILSDLVESRHRGRQ